MVQKRIELFQSTPFKWMGIFLFLFLFMGGIMFVRGQDEPVEQDVLFYLQGDENQLWQLILEDGIVSEQKYLGIDRVWDYSIDPSGRFILYSHLDEDGSDDLWLFDLELETTTVLLECEQVACRYAVWQPEGSLIAFERFELNRGERAVEIWLYDTDTGVSWAADYNISIVEDRESSLLGQFPRWSMDGRYLSYYKPDLHLIIGRDLLDWDGIPYLWPAVLGSMGDWAPDRYQLSYTAFVFAEEDIDHTHLAVDGQPLALYKHLHLIDLERELIEDLHKKVKANDGIPIWSPTGDQLLYSQGVGGERAIWFQDWPNGESKALISEPFVVHSSLSWSPDGRYISFMRFAPQGDPQKLGIWYWDWETKRLRRVVADGFMPVWGKSVR